MLSCCKTAGKNMAGMTTLRRCSVLMSKSWIKRFVNTESILAYKKASASNWCILQKRGRVMSKVEQNRATLQRWYNEMWGKCNNALIPDIAAAHYLRHDITGANNLMTSEQYRDLVGLGLGGESVKEFEYYLVAEADYVASLGRYVLNSGRQWDWVQM